MTCAGGGTHVIRVHVGTHGVGYVKHVTTRTHSTINEPSAYSLMAQRRYLQRAEHGLGGGYVVEGVPGVALGSRVKAQRITHLEKSNRYGVVFKTREACMSRRAIRWTRETGQGRWDAKDFKVRALHPLRSC